MACFSAIHKISSGVNTLKHVLNDVKMFRAIMALLGVDIPPLEGVVQLRFLMTKKRTLKIMECVEEFVDSEVLKGCATED
jgi:hypothetical protein